MRTLTSGLIRNPPLGARAEIESFLNSARPADVFQIVKTRDNASLERDRSRLRYLLLELLNGAFGPDRPFTQSWFDAIVAASPWFFGTR